MLKSLQLQRDRIALEASLVADVQSLFAGTLPMIKESFLSFTGKFLPTMPGVALTAKQHDFIREVSKHSYLDLAPLAAFVPEGLVVPYHTYLAHLLPAVKHASVVQSEVMNAYTTFLSQLINNRDAQLETRSFDKVYQAMSTERTSMNAALGSCFKAGSSKADVTYGAVVERNADWEAVFTVADEVSKIINKVDRKKLNDKIEEAVELLTILEKKVARNEFGEVTPAVAQHLADGAFQVASELEFYPAMYYKTLAINAAIDRTVKHVQTVLKK